MEEVEVRTSAVGVPTAVVRKGRVWTVGAEPVRWYERRAWWDQESRMPIGGSSRVDVEIWQVQVRPHRSGAQELVTLELVHDRGTGSWQIRAESTP